LNDGDLRGSRRSRRSLGIERSGKYQGGDDER
jgi:hypothetical protein